MTLTCFVQVNATDNFKRVEFLINLIASICSKNQFIFFILISPGKQQQHKHPLFLLETFARAAKKSFKKKFRNTCNSGNFKQLSDRNLNNRRTKNKRLLTPEIIIHAITWEIKACKSSRHVRPEVLIRKLCLQPFQKLISMAA